MAINYNDMQKSIAAALAAARREQKNKTTSKKKSSNTVSPASKTTPKTTKNKKTLNAKAKTGRSTTSTKPPTMNQSIDFSFEKAREAVNNTPKIITTPKSTVDFQYDNFLAPKKQDVCGLDLISGNDGAGILIGKDRYADMGELYNNVNRQPDILTLDNIIGEGELQKRPNMVYNGADKRVRTGGLMRMAPLTASGDMGVQAGQKNADGTWKQIAAPGTWSGSGVTSEKEQELLGKALKMQDMTRRINEGRTQFGYLENGGAQGQAQSSPKTAAETIGPPKSVGEYVSEEDYNKQADMISRQLELNKKSTDVYAGMLQIYQGNTDPEAVRMYEHAQAGYNRNLEEQSKLQNTMDVLQDNRDYSAQAEETEKSDKFFGTDVDAARDFAEKAIKLTDENNKEYAAIMTVDWVPENRNGELLLVPKYTYSDILEGEHNHVISIALAGLLIKTDGRKYLLHTHPDSENSDKGTRDEPDIFSGTPYNLFDMGDASIPTLAGADWYELPQIINNVLPNATLGSIGVSGYDGIYLCSPNGKLYYYEGTGEGEYQANTKDELENKIFNNPVARDFPETTRHWDQYDNTYTLNEK